MNKVYQQLNQQIGAANNIAIFMHRNPDGDCLGGGYTLGTLLENQGKHVHYFCPTPPSENFSFLPKIKNKMSTDFDYADYDCIICVDSANPQSMLGKFFEGQDDYFSNQYIINIDHHESNTNYGNLNIVDAEASSVCELLTEIIQELYPNEINSEIATYLFMGCSTDTGNFMYDKDSVKTFAAANYLLAAGADKAGIIKHLYKSKNYDQVKAMGLLLERMTKSGNIIYTRYTKEDLETHHLDKEQIESFLPLMTSIEHDGIFALFKTSSYDLNPTLRCSLRANTSTQNVSEIAAHFGGGGHQAAAGCAVLIEKNVEKTMEGMLGEMNGLIER